MSRRQPIKIAELPLCNYTRHGRFEPVETRHETINGRAITYQLEPRECGKARCARLHGPYWYAYYANGGRTTSVYIGREWKSLRDVEQKRRGKKGAKIHGKREQDSGHKAK